MRDFDQLVAEGQSLPIRGWDFGVLSDRWKRGEPPWDFRAIARASFRPSDRLLDLGTGGGEFLASLAPLPRHVVATEGYPPNLILARSRLEPLGVGVIPIGTDQRIDLPDRSMEVVMDRHEGFDIREVARVLRRGGTFVTQQVGSDSYAELHDRFGVPPEPSHNRLGSLRDFGEEIRTAGFEVSTLRDARFPESFRDVGAVVYFLRAAPWEVPDFSVGRYRRVLKEIHDEISRRGEWELQAHRLLAQATRLS
jgi:SAM-dependent methyltransferase